MRILVVEDDVNLNRQLADALKEAGYVVDVAFDGEEGHFLGDTEPYDAIILDIGLPEMDGITVLEKWRSAGKGTPVLLLTARDRWSDKVAGIDAGADDYVAKPFHVEEVLARIRALIRRSAGRADTAVVYQNLRLDPVTHEATRDGQPVALSAREWAVLETLMSRPGVVFTRAQIEEKLYSWKDDISSNAVEVYIHGLRKKLGSELIQNVRGVGYMVPK